MPTTTQSLSGDGIESKFSVHTTMVSTEPSRTTKLFDGNKFNYVVNENL